jgi:hypothetical protein
MIPQSIPRVTSKYKGLKFKAFLLLKKVDKQCMNYPKHVTVY